MPETPDSQENLAYIRTHVDKLERLSKFAISSNPNTKLHIESELRARKGAAEAYLAILQKPRTQDELMKALGQSQGNISKVCTHLLRMGLIQKLGTKKKNFTVTELESLIGVEKIARRVIKTGKGTTK